MHSTQHFHIQGLHCGGCVARVQKALMPYGAEVSVTLDPPRVTITHGRASLETLTAALREVGEYTLTPIPDSQAAPSVRGYRPSAGIVLMAIAVILLIVLFTQMR